MHLIEIRDPECTLCRLSTDAVDVCVMGDGPVDAKIMVVGKMPNSPTYQASLIGDLKDVGMDPTTMMFTSALKCRNFDIDGGKTAIKACKTYLDQEIELVDPDWILIFGNEALLAVLGKSGIMKYRSRVFERGRAKVFPTISPASVSRNPGQKASYMADLRLFAAEVFEKSAKVPPPKIKVIDDMPKLRWLIRSLGKATLVSFDIETTGGDEFAEGAAIVSIAGTMELDGQIRVWALPLFHPQSPWRSNWTAVVERVSFQLTKARKRIAHNGKFDLRWLRKFGYEHLTFTFDTMLAVHLLDENREKGLKPQAASRLGVKPWALDTRNLLGMPIRRVLKYNALDTYYTYHIYLQAREELIEQPRLLRIFQKITMPACNLLISVEQYGVWIDREVLANNEKIALDMVRDLEDQLMEWVPKEEDFPTKEGWTWEDVNWPISAKGKPMPINFNPSNFSKWLLFEHLGLPILETGKPKDDGSDGAPSMKELVMLELRHVHPIAQVLLNRTTWVKMAQFFHAYDTMADDRDRIHTTFKLAGTVTGRLSSGKADAEKVTGVRNLRGVNLQQVPRDPLVRTVFGASEGWTFIEADFSQIELRIAAFLSRDRTMLHLYQAGQDIHRATASWVLGVPFDKVTKDDRKKAKAVNFGFVYGMGWRKFIMTAYEKYDLTFTPEEAQAVRRAFFEQFSGLLAWHARQRRLVNHNRRVQNPIGRVRHLPDIDSPDKFVQGEAERQAINSPVQSFGSDLCMLSMIEIARQFNSQGLAAHTIGTVHDALLFEVRNDHVRDALPIIKSTMENLPLKQKFGVVVDVPIIADVSLGSHWGNLREVPSDAFTNSQTLQMWLQEDTKRNK